MWSQKRAVVTEKAGEIGGGGGEPRKVNETQ